MIKVIIKHGTYMSVGHKMRRIGGVFRNKLHISELADDTLRHMWIHQTCFTSQPSRVEDYFVQGMCLTVIYIRLEVYITCYHVVKIHWRASLPNPLRAGIMHKPEVYPQCRYQHMTSRICVGSAEGSMHENDTWIIRNSVTQVLWKLYRNIKDANILPWTTCN